jgi:hypothetical protein
MCIWQSDIDLEPEVHTITNDLPKLVPTILKVTEDDGPSFEGPGIFCDDVALLVLLHQET